MITKIEHTDNTLTITFEDVPNDYKPRLFIKPSSDYGVVGESRSNSAYHDYLTILKSEQLKVNFNVFQSDDDRELTFKFGEGDKYSNGFYLKLDNEEKPVAVTTGDRFILVLNKGNLELPLRVRFEVY